MSTEHYQNYLRYRAAREKKQQPFTASQQDTPLQYLPYAHYPATPTVEEQAAEQTAARLQYLRQQIQAESISYGEIAELQGLADQIDPADVELLEWAGVEEQAELLEQPLPDTALYRSMAVGHQIRKGHALQAVLVSSDGGSLWHQVYKCCQSAEQAEEQQA
jgi:hypothetical protein